MTQDFQTDDVIPNATEIVERFGGIRPMASKLNVPVTTVQGWKKRDAIPAIRRDEILNAAAHYDVNLKGLMSETANENARAPSASVRIAEDPALASAPRPSVTPLSSAPSQQSRNLRGDIGGGVDLRQIRSTARRTSFWTSVCLLALVGGAGVLLFGTGMGPQSVRVRVLENRVSNIEAQSRNVQPSPGNSSLTLLQKEVSDLSAVVAGSSDALSRMAHDVAAGTGAPLMERLKVLEQQLVAGAGASAPALSNMMSHVETMTQTPQGAAEWQSAIDDLRGLVTGLQGRTDQLDTALAQAKTENDALGRTLSDVSGHDLGAAAMLLALTQLREAADRQTPFTDDLAFLRDVAAGTDPELAASVDKMAPYAQTGILSPGALKRELQASANDIITAKLKGEDVSMKDKVMGRLQSLFSIRREGAPVAGGDERALINQASAQLDAGDVAGAMVTLQKLDGPAAQAATPWQNKAEATVAAQALDAQLVTSIIAKVKSGLSSVAGSSALPGVVNAGPINMGPAVTSAPAPSPMPSMMQPEAPAQDTAPVATPQATIPEAGSSLPDMPAPDSTPQQSGAPVVIQQ